ncbi:MAG TPA: sigma-54-dependent Fis family transcriptional regulator [Rectinemataceae bacterium]|nr:sigma-54-dependent Fis family transcriptional regulator [Rectinemataceae bacterium]
MNSPSRPDRDYIRRSFERCRSYGVDGNAVHSRRIIDGAAFEERLARRRTLIRAAGPFIDRLYGFVKGSGFFAILTDEEGCILSMDGDDAILSEAYGLRMIPGAFMDEKSIGTNAMGTALAEGMPVQVSGAEHFITAYHRWTCSGAPIRDAEGRVVGSLDLTGDCADVHLHTLGMVVAAANAIEAILVLDARNADLRENQRFAETLVDSIEAGIVSAALDGKLISVNSHALSLFGYSRDEMLARRAEELFVGWPDVLGACVSGREYQNEDVLVSSHKNRLYFNLSAYPIKDEEDRAEAVILVFKDVRKVRRQADQIAGRRAVYTFDKIIGASPKLLEVVDIARKVADSRSTVLITGESGTGKEIFAQAIQNASPRRDQPFVVINCGAIPRTLIESELFGYVDGAFTGARRGGQSGKFEVADGGTIFLDEVGEMPIDLQTRLLRVIEEGTVTRVGDTHDIPVDVRIIAATNKDLRAEVERGNFRMDLFYRLDVLPIRLPPLREQRESIPVLVDYYMRRISRRINKRPVSIDPAYMAALAAYDWPGNVRELENLIELIINTERLPPLPGPAAAVRSARAEQVRSGSLEEAELQRIREALAQCGDNVSSAARLLGIGRNTLYRKVQRLDPSLLDRN